MGGKDKVTVQDTRRCGREKGNDNNNKKEFLIKQHKKRRREIRV
jgi:hypothetical protein